MLEDLEDFVINTRNEETGPYGTLRVQATEGYALWFLAPLLPDFIRRYPHLRIDLVTEAATQNPVEDGCDVIVASKKPVGPGLIGRDIGVVRHVICASPDYFRRHGKPERPQDLQQHNCLVNSPFSPREWRFREGSKEISVWVKGMLCSNSTAILTQMALEGIGIVRVPGDRVRAELESGALESIFDDITCSRERIRAYYSKTKYLPAKTIAFVEFLETAFAGESE